MSFRLEAPVLEGTLVRLEPRGLLRASGDQSNVTGGRGRNYFEAPMVPASNYRVLVFSYERIEGNGLGPRRVW